jgi:hypothetical protein
MTAKAGLFQSPGDGVELVIAHVVDRDLVKSMAKGDEREFIPLEPQFHAEGGQGTEDKTADTAVFEDLGDLLSGAVKIADPVGLYAIT